MSVSKYLFLLLSLLLLSCNTGNDDTVPPMTDMGDDTSNLPNTGRIRTVNDGFEITYEYNDDDRLIKASGDDANQTIENTYTYDGDGNVMLKGVYEFFQHGNVFDIQFSYEYDAEGKIIAFGHNQGENAVVTYQENQATADFGSGPVLVVVNLDANGRVVRLETSYFYKIFTYDIRGNLILNEEYDSDTDELTKTYQYTYDTNINPFFNQVGSKYVADFIFLFWGSGWTFNESTNYDFPYLPNNLTSISYNNEQPITFTYTYNSENQIVEAIENDPSNGITNYSFTYY